MQYFPGGKKGGGPTRGARVGLDPLQGFKADEAEPATYEILLIGYKMPFDCGCFLLNSPPADQ